LNPSARLGACCVCQFRYSQIVFQVSIASGRSRHVCASNFREWWAWVDLNPDLAVIRVTWLSFRTTYKAAGLPNYAEVI
jgi:hypothetical protein